MKRFLTFFAFAAALVFTAGCEDNKKTETSSIEFSRQLYSVSQKSSVDIAVKVSKAPETDITVPLSFSGTAEEGTGYTVSSSDITIAAGETSGYITLTNKDLGAEDEVKITFASLPAGYESTSKNFTIVNLDSQEGIIYSFEYESGDVLDKFIATIKVSGTDSGTQFAAEEKIAVPATLSGEGASLLEMSDNGNFIIEKGENTGKITLTLKDPDYAGAAAAVLGVGNTGRFIKGDNPEMDVTVKGVLSVETLLGKWNFDETIDVDELEMWFAEMEDDPSLLPTHNAGFSLTFAKDGNDFTVTPSGTGDWMNYFRTSAICRTEPVNMTAEGYVLGAYTSDENQMFVAEADTPRQQLTYFRLDKANRAFSADEDKIGTGTIAMRLRNDGKLEIHIKDYDTPPFGEMWWDGFDADMFSFASTFTKAQ